MVRGLRLKAQAEPEAVEVSMAAQAQGLKTRVVVVLRPIRLRLRDAVAMDVWLFRCRRFPIMDQTSPRPEVLRDQSVGQHLLRRH